MRVVSVLGGRPHLVKSETIHLALERSDIRHETVECWLGPLSDYPWTSADFQLPAPLEVISEQSAGRLAGRLRRSMASVRPHVLLLYGDLDVTLLALGIAHQLDIPTVHIESGYRTGDLADREEFIRVAVDHGVTHRVAFTSSMAANLHAEGIDPGTVSHYDNPALFTMARRLRRPDGAPAAAPSRKATGLVTFHRDENVLDPERLVRIVGCMEALAASFALTIVLFRRTDLQLRRLGIRDRLEALAATAAAVRIRPTLRHEEYVAELSRASFVITDSSTVQDECAFLGTDCFVLRQASPRAADFPPTTRIVESIEPAQLASLAAAAVQRRRETPAKPDVLARGYDSTFVELLKRLTTTGGSAFEALPERPRPNKASS
ncbi:UDP-N-acetylglucosamine 2-epimerase [Actinocrinis puniceicyclus]|uniref:UDP-N-acetylglucosamine 2-epimerase n=1 Tax=Actinocrinis puniceicyclus TaxID=977794 RepID=A0A8J8BER0_9ACTN|nr:UDP-N-acetylglucosamine 2-epimerase [Actinocrinis puniceicyclus]MBS2965830.1 UDP-N-acetylglucosamine 2-epimerase [Actinocrinis puniceicyclus]